MTSTPNRRPTTPARRRALAAVAVAGSLAVVSAGCSASSGDVAGATSAASDAASQASSAVAEASGAAADAAGSRVPTGAGTQGRDKELQRQLDALVEAGYPGVAASVTGSDGKTVHYTAGVGDVRTEAPMPVDPHVRIASNTKTFTATVVMQLVGEGKVDLDAPVETYLPGLVRGQGIDGRNITVRQLLQQTSGLPAYNSLVPGGDVANVQHTYLEPRCLLDAALAEPAHFAPGQEWEYSNTNYVLAGLDCARFGGHEVVSLLIRAEHDHGFDPTQVHRGVQGPGGILGYRQQPHERRGRQEHRRSRDDVG